MTGLLSGLNWQGLLDLMPQLSLIQEEKARKYEQAILQRLASTGLAAAALAAEVDESTVSRWKEKLIRQQCRVLACLGLKVVPDTMRCFDPADIDSILHQAQRWMQHVKSAEQLAQEAGY